ncbi:kinesin-like protein KIF14 isoform X2 [Ornithorhynchus anatinus]|uniref:Kinesin-like protein KIF14 n=1 Tax=Ornithorhynchus anatinus TaxID=9258 RepID=F7EUI9_ORNAN|nr:kinesin-like protein KIF14 isoform X2 [Ornithorhynchus anatinus]
MSVYTASIQNPSNALGISSSRNNSSVNIITKSSRLGQQLKTQISVCKNDNLLSQSIKKIQDVNRTYVVSACKRIGDNPVTPKTDGRLTLQRRTVKSTESPFPGDQLATEPEKTRERPFTLRHRERTDSLEKCKINKSVGSGGKNAISVAQQNYKEKVANADKDSYTRSTGPLVETQRDLKVKPNPKSTESSSTPKEENGTVSLKSLTNKVSTNLQNPNEVRVGHLNAIKSIENTVEIQIPPRGTMNDRIPGEETVCTSDNKYGSLERSRTPRQWTTGQKISSKRTASRVNSPATSCLKSRASCLQVMTNKKGNSNSLPANKSGILQHNNPLDQEEMATQISRTEAGLVKVENSKVTVAARVRPFSNREKTEKASQVVFMNGQETTVQHPDMKQIYSFIYDFSFWSFDECHPNYASQMKIYEQLAVPLLERAFEGYNTCLFAYGQTGSGKSYTMMGFGEERGIIPRFCEDLFARVAQQKTQEISYHLEMSFFEVYNEKIHDLLVVKAENGQKKQPLRVREHPVSGPYVEDLSVNVVSSSSDVQSWLELGNKQRATAATGMNDKSSRSHSVVTLVMTQTKTEYVEEEEHDHRITSRINLIDLAGSERCTTAQTSGERLKEGASINKSLLTLGKVISALSDQVYNQKRVFIPYRDSVLTWLLKESLGGNSKTTMIATISPAASNLEETLSTLRYAKQARLIVNIAKVNEDMNAKLIRELKAEIEKLKAAQRSTQNIDPERYSRCRQEITSLRMKLHQQERDIAEMQRAWKQKFEQAELRKVQETKELQKAGITFKMDNRLPNLVNLNEDPQLSEMLLYMIKEGQTTVGKYKPNSNHDIQLSGVLIADDHCVIKNFDGTVSITPLGEAKTYVNGKHISELTVLHHSDRVILGGDHYFRFNHPVEVQKGKRSAYGTVLPSDGAKDFEFAKNELLMAQRSELEAEIKEARLKAKEEMMQGIQIAKELAQQELSSQRTAYESRIKALEAELKEESQRKKMQEMNNRTATHKIQELEKVKQHLEQEVHVNKKRLEMEALATKQALEDHTIRHAKILEALEDEKQKIAKEVQALQQSRNNRDKALIPPNWNSMKLSMMIQEANTISKKLRKCTVFCRHDIPDRGNSTEPSVQIQVRNLQLGISTFWSLEKFESKLLSMKELYESNNNSRDDDVFYDPGDEWEPDLANTSISSFSRRRSRSLMKNKRISECLLDLKVHPIQKLQPLHSPAESFLPGICKEFIGSALNCLGQSYEEEKTLADSLISNFLKIHIGVTMISNAHEKQDEESQENLFSMDRATQSFSIQMTSSFEQLVVLSKHWLDSLPKCSGTSRPDEDLREEIKNLGGFLQLFLQGCCSDISSMVKEAQNKVIQTVQQAVKCVVQLAILKGTKLHFSEYDEESEAGVQMGFKIAIFDGVRAEVKSLLESGLEKTRDLQKELLRQNPQDEVQKDMKAKAVSLIKSLENIMTEWKKKDIRPQNIRPQTGEEASGLQDLEKIISFAMDFVRLNHCIDQAGQIITSTLQGSYSDLSLLKNCVEDICNSAGHFHDYFSWFSASFSSLSSSSSKLCEPLGDLKELESIAESLLTLSFEPKERPDVLKPWETCVQNMEDQEKQHKSNGTESTRKKGVPKRVYELHPPSRSSADHSSRRIQWV